MNNRYWLLLSCMIFSSWITTLPLIDLEDNAQDFILDVKQIEIPGFPGAFNGSIMRWQDKILLCFRVRNEQMISTFQMGCVLLDDEFNVISDPHIIEWREGNPSTFMQAQDPRLIMLHDTVYMVFSNFITINNVVSPRRMFLAELVYDGDQFFMKRPLCVHTPDITSARWEKNWVPFVYEHILLLSYSLMPHNVLVPSLHDGVTRSLCMSCSDIAWPWGELRGGTPAVRDGNSYLAFFHSSLIMASVHSQGKKIQHYLMGAYRIQASPPFAITHISAEPIAGEGFYHGKEYPTWKPLRVVFPMGCIVGDEYVWVSYGRQDFEIWIATFDKKKLYESMVPCAPIACGKHVGYRRSVDSMPTRGVRS